MLIVGLENRSPAFSEMVFLIIVTCSSTLSATTSKASSTLDGLEWAYRIVLMSATWFIIFFWTITSFMEAAYVPSLAQYIPQVTFGSILMNANTGLIVCIVARVYYCNLLAGYGVYLISDLDFFKAQAQDQQGFHRQVHNIQDFFSDIEKDLPRARLERTLSRHQITIISKSSRQGLRHVLILIALMVLLQEEGLQGESQSPRSNEDSRGAVAMMKGRTCTHINSIDGTTSTAAMDIGYRILNILEHEKDLENQMEGMIYSIEKS